MRPLWWRCRKVGWEKTSHRWHLTFYVSNLWRRRDAARVCTNYNYTWAKSRDRPRFSLWRGGKKQSRPSGLAGFIRLLVIKFCFIRRRFFWFSGIKEMKGWKGHKGIQSSFCFSKAYRLFIQESYCISAAAQLVSTYLCVFAQANTLFISII